MAFLKVHIGKYPSPPTGPALWCKKKKDCFPELTESDYLNMKTKFEQIINQFVIAGQLSAEAEWKAPHH